MWDWKGKAVWGEVCHPHMRVWSVNHLTPTKEASYILPTVQLSSLFSYPPITRINSKHPSIQPYLHPSFSFVFYSATHSLCFFAYPHYSLPNTLFNFYQVPFTSCLLFFFHLIEPFNVCSSHLLYLQSWTCLISLQNCLFFRFFLSVFCFKYCLNGQTSLYAMRVFKLFISSTVLQFLTEESWCWS